MVENLAVIGYFVLCTVLVAISVLRPCGCPVRRSPYVKTRHDKPWVMLAYAFFALVSFIVGCIIVAEGKASLSNWILLVVNALIFGWWVAAYYYHEKGKKKRSILRGLGRVFINEHGRLRVDHKGAV